LVTLQILATVLYANPYANIVTSIAAMIQGLSFLLIPVLAVIYLATIYAILTFASRASRRTM
jgi:hypothetical protein